MIEAKIICDSLNPVGCRLTTFVLKYPRFILAELNTHRVCSRSSASARAIPVIKIISSVREEPVIPIYWGKNQKGMKADEELPESLILEAERIWLESMESQIQYAEKLLDLGVHKQITNRLLEPYFYVRTLLSATDLGNFFNLRAHPDAQPEFQELAFQMLEEYEKSQPRQLEKGEWHTPFSDKFLKEDLNLGDKLKICTARAARVSYNNFFGEINYEDDFRLHDDLKKMPHASPFESCAVAMGDDKYYGNFCGFKQYRKFLANENMTKFNPDQLKAARRHYGRKNNSLEKVARPI
jgi:thymidylate synthase ThyX